MSDKYKVKYKVLIFGILLMLFLVVGGYTVSYLRKEKVQEYSNAISSLTCLDIEFINEQDIINLNEAFPITDNDAIKTLKSYKFTVRNTCQNDISAEINLESLQVEKQLSKEYIKVYFKAESQEEPLISILDILGDRDALTNNATSDNLTTINIEGYGQKNFELKLWIDYATTAEQGMNKYYEGKIAIKASPLYTYTDIYGVRRDIASESSQWERIGLSANLVADSAIVGLVDYQNDFDNIYPWSDIITYNYQYDSSTGNVTEIMYGEDGFSFDGSSGEVLTRIPEFYYDRYRKTEEDGKTYEYVVISPTYKEGYYKSETFSVGRYTISGAANDVHSKSGVLPLASKSLKNYRDYIQNTTTLGNDFSQMDYHYFILQLLYLVEYADYNSQNFLGLGSVNNGKAISSGGCDTLGMRSGTLINDGDNSMIYRGIEDIYGNVGQFIDGLNIKNCIVYVCTNPSMYATNVYTGCYKQVGYTNLELNGVYVKELGYDESNPLIALPVLNGGSSTTYITDKYFSGLLDSKGEGYAGGNWSSSDGGGLWTWTFVGPSNYYAFVGARLLRTN